MLGLPSDYNQNMAIKFIAPFSVLLFFPSSCQAKPENFSEAQCKVLQVGQETAPEFCVQASEKGVRIVYLDLNFRNDSYRPALESRSRYGSTDEASANVNAENNDSVPSVTLAIPTQSQQANSHIGAYTSNKHMQSLLYLDEPNPITFSYFLRNYTKERTELFSFHSKFAFLWYCVIPIFVYLRLGLNYIVESKFMKEVHKKPTASLVGPLFSYLFDFQGFLSWLMALAPLILILLSSPKDFLITVREDVRQVICLICKENTVSVGEDMLRHLRKLAVNSYKLASCLINFHLKALAGSKEFFTHWAIGKVGPSLKRAKTPFIALWVLFWDVILVMVVGVIFGGISLCLLLLGLVLLIFWYSPWFSLLSACGRKLRQVEKRWIGRENPNCDKSCLKLLVVNIFQFFIYS